MNDQNINCLLLDLDDTLYPRTNGAWEMIKDRINQFLINEMGFPEEIVFDLRARLWKEYGTTLRGLQAEFSVDMDAYLNYVHDVPLELVIHPNPDLDRILKTLPQRKVVFTNANRTHAQRVLALLGITDHFDTIVDVYAVAPYCKPAVEAFQKALSLIKEKPEYCLLVDDSPANLATAQSLGLATASIGLRRHDGSPHLERINDIGSLFKVI